jgi:hypothetical protein
VRWSNEDSGRLYTQDSYSRSLDIIIAETKTENVFSEGYINWNVYQKARAKLRTNLNGSWMFEKPQKDENPMLKIFNCNDYTGYLATDK